MPIAHLKVEPTFGALQTVIILGQIDSMSNGRISVDTFPAFVCTAKVNELDVAIGVEHHILHAEVSVSEAKLMQMLDGSEHFGNVESAAVAAIRW